jgi:hypothetical protein
MKGKSSLRESAQRFTSASMCLVLDFRLWARLGLGFRVRPSLVGYLPPVIGFSSRRVALIANNSCLPQKAVVRIMLALAPLILRAR